MADYRLFQIIRQGRLTEVQAAAVTNFCCSYTLFIVLVSLCGYLYGCLARPNFAMVPAPF